MGRHVRYFPSIAEMQMEMASAQLSATMPWTHSIKAVTLTEDPLPSTTPSACSGSVWSLI
jgi:hypothetical protein